MTLEAQIRKENLLAACPNCRQNTLTLAHIQKPKPRSGVEQVLACRFCRLLVPVDEFKNMLCTV